MPSQKSNLEIQTLRYWKVSSVWNGRINKKMTISGGISVIRDVTCHAQGYRLFASAMELEDQIVRNRFPSVKSNRA